MSLPRQTRASMPGRQGGGMTHRTPFTARRAVAVLATTGLTGLALVATAPAAQAATSGQDRPAVDWHPCPVYSDATVAILAPPDKVEQYKALLARMECASVAVPLDYARPRGRSITVGFTRLKATDQRHRLGSLAVNPGGPGGSGALMPLGLITGNDVNAGLNERYDLIGFDPRGVGASTRVDCPRPPGEPPQEPIGAITKDVARDVFAFQRDAQIACANSDPAFIGQLTTANVARDLDRIRAGLGERNLNYLGVSWGTWLGVVYRSLFPASTGRMFLDSVAIPRFSLPAFEDGRAAAAERNARRFTAWVAERDAQYHLGATVQAVQAVLTGLVADFDAHPRTFTDLPRPLDGSLIALADAQPAPGWPTAAQVLSELRTATGPAAPPTVKEVLGDDGEDPGPPPADLPEEFNPVLNLAAFCNEDPARLGFDADWASYQRRLAANPLTGRTNPFGAGCAGWPLPVQEFHLRPGGGTLVLSGHRWETPSPYEWTLQTQALVGGRVYTVDDDIHGSVLREPACTADVVTFFDTGRIDGGCAGVTPGPTAKAQDLKAASRLDWRIG
jgi:pimeloyl-ACP methyl ester carboxylesterase